MPGLLLLWRGPAEAPAAPVGAVLGAPGIPAAFWRRRPHRSPVAVPAVIPLRPLPPLDLWAEDEVLVLLALLTGDRLNH